MARAKHVERLLSKAAQDEYVLDRLLSDDSAPIEVFGFHAQQAVEKLLKAVLSALGVNYPRTHRVVELPDLVRTEGVEVPEVFDELRHLTPFAVEFRYDVGPEDQEQSLEKTETRERINELRRWVETCIAAVRHSAP